MSVVFMHLNLTNNSDGFYHLSKITCIPFVLGVQYFLYNQKVSKWAQSALILIIIGVVWATVHGVSVNMVGTLYAAGAVAATGMTQIYTSTCQKSCNINAVQLLSQTAPLIAVGILLVCPMFDDMAKLWSFQYTPGLIVRVFVSCFFALGMNISSYVVLGKTSPVTYQVLGHLKTMVAIVLGVVFFHKHLNERGVMGVVVTIGGVVAYTEVKRHDTDAPKETNPTSSTLLDNL